MLAVNIHFALAAPTDVDLPNRVHSFYLGLSLHRHFRKLLCLLN